MPLTWHVSTCQDGVVSPSDLRHDTTEVTEAWQMGDMRYLATGDSTGSRRGGLERPE